jgi:hypothetical protein
MLGLLLILLAQAEPATKPAPAAEVTPRTKAILARLEQPIAIEFPQEWPLNEVLRHIKRSSTKGPDDPGIPIYVEPLGLQRVDKSLLFPVTISAKAIRAKDALARILNPLGLAYIVKDDVLFISNPEGIRRERGEVAVRAGDASPATMALLARLEEPVAMPFAHETPLGDVLAYLKRATAGRPLHRGIEILVVPEGLKEAEVTLQWTIEMDLEGVPLKTTLRLMLDQLRLACVVKHGRLVIHSREGIRKLIRNAEGPGRRADGPDRDAARGGASIGPIAGAGPTDPVPRPAGIARPIRVVHATLRKPPGRTACGRRSGRGRGGSGPRGRDPGAVRRGRPGRR